MSRVVGRLLIAALLLTGLLIPASASAFPLTTCTATLTSLDGGWRRPADTVDRRRRRLDS